MRKNSIRPLTIGAGTLFLLLAVILALLTRRPGSNGSPDSPLYFNDEFGFQLNTPAGWFLHENPSLAGRVAVINKSKSPKEEYPAVGISVDPLERYGNSSGFGWRAIEVFKTSKGAALVEPLSEIAVGSLKGLRFTVGNTSATTETPVTFQQYIFEKQGRAVSFIYSNKSADFEKDSEGLLDMIGTLKFVEGFVDLQNSLATVQPRFMQPNLDLYNKWWKKDAIRALSDVEVFRSLELTKDASGATVSYTRGKFLSHENYEVYRWHKSGNGNPLNLWRIVDGEIFYHVRGYWIDLYGLKHTHQDGMEEWKEYFSKLTPGRYRSILENEKPSAIDAMNQDYVIVQFSRRASPEDSSGPAPVILEQELWMSKADNLVRIERVKAVAEASGETQAFYLGYNSPFALEKPQVIR